MTTLQHHLNQPPILPPVPMGVARSALFGVGSDSDKSLLNACPIANSPFKGSKLTYTGPRLNQHHALTWQAVIQAATEQGVTSDQPFTVPAAQLLKAMGGKGDDSKQRERLWGWLTDLVRTQIVYRSDTQDYVGPLLFEALRQKPSGRLILRLNTKMFRLLGDEVLKNNLARKASLGRNQIALWMHDYLSTHLRPPAESLDTLRKWCGSSLLLPQFRPRLRAAMELLASGAEPLVLNWSIDPRDRLVVQKADTKVVMLSPTVAQAKQAGARSQDRHAESIRMAREQRCRVAL